MLCIRLLWVSRSSQIHCSSLPPYHRTRTCIEIEMLSLYWNADSLPSSCANKVSLFCDIEKIWWVLMDAKFPREIMKNYQAQEQDQYQALPEPPVRGLQYCYRVDEVGTSQAVCSNCQRPKQRRFQSSLIPGESMLNSSKSILDHPCDWVCAFLLLHRTSRWSRRIARLQLSWQTYCSGAWGMSA